MFKSILATALLTSVLASGAMAAAPLTKPTAIAKHPTVLVHKASMKKMMMKHHCAKSKHMSKGKCVANKKY
jgi:predicted S18 family serine protease